MRVFVNYLSIHRKSGVSFFNLLFEQPILQENINFPGKSIFTW